MPVLRTYTLFQALIHFRRSKDTNDFHTCLMADVPDTMIIWHQTTPKLQWVQWIKRRKRLWEGASEGSQTMDQGKDVIKTGRKSMTSLVCSIAYFHISGFSNFMDEMALIWVDKNRGGRENSGSCEAELLFVLETVSLKCLSNIQILYPGVWSLGQKLGTWQCENHSPMGGFQSIELGYHKGAGLSLGAPALRDQRNKGPWYKKGRRNREWRG